MGRISRRDALCVGAGAALFASAAYGADDESLHKLAAAKGLSFGSAVGAGPGGLAGSFSDARYRALLLRECGVLVCENEMKWYALRPNAQTFDFARADLIADFAKANGLALRGHNLLWHSAKWSPAWLNAFDFGSSPASTAEALVKTHIERVCARYPQIRSWDVVNEAVDPETGALRETSVSKAMGEGVLDLAFHVAREAAPNAELVYNDYMSWGAWSDKHRAGVLRLLEGFKKRGAPVDAVGLQSHISAPEYIGAAEEKDWRTFLDDIVGMGLALLVTEFDVNDVRAAGSAAERDVRVATSARRYLDLVLSYPQTKSVLAWGLCDRYSWLLANDKRSDGAPLRPTPYDADYRRKPLREAIAAALRSAPSRSAT